MKKLNLFVLTVVVLLASCDVLNPDPKNNIEAGTPALDTRAGALALLNGAYDELQDNDVSETLMIMPGMQADLSRWDGSFPDWAEIDRNNILSGNSTVDAFWDDIYDLINVTNTIIADVPGIEDPEFGQEEKDQITGEAHVLRALAYHFMVRWYNEIPVVLEPVDAKDEAFALPAKSSVADVYTQIFADLDQAESLLAAGNARSGDIRASYYAAVALKARAHLYFGNYLEANGQGGADAQYQIALDKANEVLDDGPYQLAANYNDIFGRTETDAQNSVESIWELAFTSSDANSMWFWAQNRQEYLAENVFRNQVAQNAGDTRLSRLFRMSGSNVLVNKYFRGDGSDNMIMVRLAEIILIRSEVLGRLNFTVNQTEAIDELNRIRARANIPEYAYTDINSEEELIDAILLERKVELAYEGHRWFDLVRTGRAVATLGLSSPDRTLWPIPAEEIDKNENLRPQNPGY